MIDAPAPAAQLVAPLNINDIIETLPHRYPFLLVDRILELGDNHVVGQKCVTINEWFFQGHFPQQPVMPGVLMIEALAQTAAVLARRLPENKDRLVFLAGIDGARFRRIVAPGDVLRLEVTETYRRRGVGKCNARALVGDEVACEAVITFVAQPKG